MYQYRRRVQFYETDLMGIVHHGNYLRFYEEARVAWAIDRGLINYQKKESASRLAVYETSVKHIKTLAFGDDVLIELQVRQMGAKIEFQYKMYRMKTRGSAEVKPLEIGDCELVSVAKTIHVAIEDLKPRKPAPDMRKIIELEQEKNQWNETWLLSL